MDRSNAFARIGVLVGISVTVAACNDVGDSFAVPDDSGPGDATAQEVGQGVGDGSASDAPQEAASAPDGEAGGTHADASEADADATIEEPDTSNGGGQETGALDTSAQDTGAQDTSTEDASVQDTGAQDTGTQDAGAHDATVDSAGEAGTEDSGGADAADVSPGDAGEAGADANAEAGPDASDGGGLVPCTAAGQTNCVKCDANTSLLCTPTEAVFVARDIEKGLLTNGQLTQGTPATESCYECLWNAGCLNDNTNVDMGHECGDLTGTVGAGAQASETKTEACLNTLNCVLSSGCQNAKAQNGPNATDGISNCFCGSNNLTTTACAAQSGGVPNGSCYQTDLDGFGETSSTAITTILGSFTTRTSGSGMANAIFQCAGSNAGMVLCPTCL